MNRMRCSAGCGRWHSAHHRGRDGVSVFLSAMCRVHALAHRPGKDPAPTIPEPGWEAEAIEAGVLAPRLEEPCEVCGGEKVIGKFSSFHGWIEEPCPGCSPDGPDLEPRLGTVKAPPAAPRRRRGLSGSAP